MRCELCDVPLRTDRSVRTREQLIFSAAPLLNPESNGTEMRETRGGGRDRRVTRPALHRKQTPDTGRDNKVWGAGQHSQYLYNIGSH